MQVYDEPFADSSQVPTAILSRLARTKVTVSLSGDAGDELFAGYPRYLWAHRTWEALRRLPLAARRMAGNVKTGAVWIDSAHQLAARLLPQSLSFHNAGAKGMRLLEAADAESLSEYYARLLSFTPDSLVDDGSPEESPLLSSRFCSMGLAPLALLRLTDFCTYLVDDILVKVDRAAMAASLETRVPFLDHRIIEFAASLPTSVLMPRGTPKAVLRSLLARYVPSELFDRPKKGFSIPLQDWLRGPLREWAEALLSADALGRWGFLKVDRIRALWNEHLSQRRDRQDVIWAVLMLQAWREEMKVQAAGG